MHFVQAKGILSGNGMNLCRGCLHGCIYCDSRSHCYGMDHPFEDIEIKENALELLETALRGRKKPCMLGTGAMSDPYLPLKESRALTRGALELIEKYGFGLAIQTKSADILEDLDILLKIQQKTRVVVQMTLTTMDEGLCRILEPNVSTTRERLAALSKFREVGIDTFVWLSPILPYLNDTPENISGILRACHLCGVKGVLCFGMGLTLREGNREYFYHCLDQHFPGLKGRYIREYGNAYAVMSPRNKELMELFHAECENYGFIQGQKAIFAQLRRFENWESRDQLGFF